VVGYATFYHGVKHGVKRSRALRDGSAFLSGPPGRVILSLYRQLEHEEVSVNQIRRAIVSVSDKTGLVDLVRFLSSSGVEILSTGGTARTLREAGIPVTDVSAFTGFPEILDGRVKTLHPKIYGGLLSIRSNENHQRQMEENGLLPIDLVVCNLYPFEETLRSGASHDEIIENIDIGGPTMIRAAAKNYRDVVVITRPSQYPALMEEMKNHAGRVSEEFALSCALEVFRTTSRYDTLIASYFAGRLRPQALPDVIPLRLEKVSGLRYGENPHQAGAFYRTTGTEAYGLASAQVLQGKELSFNNYLDLEAVLSGVREFDEPTAYIVKHTSPCGVASRPSLAEAYRLALECDPLSAFGGIVGLNRAVDGETAQAMLEGMEKYGFLECILAPSFSEEAKRLFARKKNLRLVAVAEIGRTDPFDCKRVTGGFVVQEMDSETDPKEIKVVTRRAPTAQEKTDLLFAWRVVKTTKSNAIVYAKECRTVGIGGGVYSRVDANRLAAAKAGERAKGAVLASDAFFPFPDNIEVAARAGVTAIIQPGGSLKDSEAIAACDRYGIAMVFTGVRHFKH